MPLFRKHSTTSPDRHGTTTSTTHHGTATETRPTRRSGFFSRGGNSLTHREDASIVAARERVASAEAAERDADRALIQARTAVKEAREHVRRLEKEAAEEARLAKIKQHQAADISKRARPLGRHH